MSPETYEILAIVALVLTALPVLYAVASVAWACIRHRGQARARGPDRHIVHPRLGSMTGRGDLWETASTDPQGPLHCFLAGSQAGPDPGLAAGLESVLGRLDELRRLAIDRLMQDDLDAPSLPTEGPPMHPGAFHLQAIDFLWENMPDKFALEFALQGDPDGVWRVEFDGDRPVATGCDD